LDNANELPLTVLRLPAHPKQPSLELAPEPEAVEQNTNK